MGFFNKVSGALFGGHGMIGGRGGPLGILGGGGSWGGGNPAQAGMGYLNQNPAIGKQYYEPFIQQGQQAQGVVNPIYDQQARDPNTFMNDIMRNYTPSEGYKYRSKQNLGAAQNSAAMGGFTGTPYDQDRQAAMVNGLMSEDMQNFLQNIMGIQGQGLAGQEQRINRGYESSGNLADYLGGNLGQQASLNTWGQQQNNINTQGRRNAKMKFFSNLAGIGGMPGMGG